MDRKDTIKTLKKIIDTWHPSRQDIESFLDDRLVDICYSYESKDKKELFDKVLTYGRMVVFFQNEYSIGLADHYNIYEELCRELKIKVVPITDGGHAAGENDT